MSSAASSAGAAAAAEQARMIQALKAIGSIVKIESDVFADIIQKSDEPLVVVSKQTRWFKTFYACLTNYKGLFFYAESAEVPVFPDSCEIILAEKIWIPSL